MLITDFGPNNHNQVQELCGQEMTKKIHFQASKSCLKHGVHYSPQNSVDHLFWDTLYIVPCTVYNCTYIFTTFPPQ